MLKLGRGRKLARFVAWVMIASTTVFHDSILWSVDDSDHCLDLAIVGSEDDLFLNAMTQFLLDHIRKDASQGSRMMERSFDRWTRARSCDSKGITLLGFRDPNPRSNSSAESSKC